MKVVFCVLHLSALVCLASAGDAIKDRSPDGKFALHLTDDSAATVEADSRKLVLDLYLDVAGPGWIERAKCLWSPDSKRFAFYSPDRRGGSATIYQRKDSAFEKVELPDVPSCEVGRVFEASEKPKRWLKSNALALIARYAWTRDDGEGECEQTITVGFDSQGKASIQSVRTKTK